MNPHFSGRLALQQRVLPNYRTPFFDMLAQACDGGMSLFAGSPRPVEGITSGESRIAKYVAAHNIHILGGPLYLCYQRGLIDWLADWDPDALIVEANPRYLATPAAVRRMHARGRKVIAWGLGGPATRPPAEIADFRSTRSGSQVKRLFSYMNQVRWRNFLRQFDALISYSQRGAQEYAALGFPLQKIFVAHNAVASRPTSMPDRQAIDSEKQPTVLFVGRLQPRKRVDSLLHACAEMPQPKPRLVIVGDGPERRNLESLARQVYPSAEFIGTKHGDELKPYFAEADLFVLPGTGGLAVQEAMANSLPVIVAKGDGTQDDLVRAENGWQIEPENYGALVETMRTALSDPGRLRKMGAESYRIVSEEINLEKMVDVFAKALNSLK